MVLGEQLGSGRLGEVLFSTETLACWEGQEDCCGCYYLGYTEPPLTVIPMKVILADLPVTSRAPHGSQELGFGSPVFKSRFC